VLKDVLQRYERGIGQQINPSKCSIMFGADCMQENMELVKQILQVEHIAEEEKYLGLPTPEGRLNKEKFKTT
jgi:hypothetical protein